jgi:antirestriction protein ArdC
VAELTSANLCAHAGIASPVIENQAAYLQSWLNVLQEDTKAIVWAAGKAARAADFILGRTFEDTTEEAAA